MYSVILILCIQYDKPWTHSNIRFCYRQSLCTFTFAILLGHIFSTPKVFCMRYLHFCNVSNNCYKQKLLLFGTFQEKYPTHYSKIIYITQHTSLTLYLVITHQFKVFQNVIYTIRKTFEFHTNAFQNCCIWGRDNEVMRLSIHLQWASCLTKFVLNSVVVLWTYMATLQYNLQTRTYIQSIYLQTWRDLYRP